jgi:fatty acid desaturase
MRAQRLVRILTLWWSKLLISFKDMGESRKISSKVEWPTIVVLAGCYLGWLGFTWFYAWLGPWLFVLLTAPVVTLHSSLQHEALHGHPTRSARLNEALVFPPLGLLFPYRRFKSLHLKHHDNSALTDPYDDPESFYYAVGDWQKLPAWLQKVLDANNTFLGRFTIGPLVMLVGFAAAEVRLIQNGDRQVMAGWARHVAGLALVFLWIAIVCGIPVWLYVASAYLGLSILNLRTFAEHQAHEAAGARSVIVEASPVFGLLFLNNNLHYVHHEHPRVPWYDLPALYRARRAEFLAANESYTYRGYGDMLRRYLFRQKAPVPHPFLHRG